MGMFDYIICEYPLPDDPAEWIKRDALDRSMQTKSLNCFLETYRITVDGKLLKEMGEVGEEESITYHGDVFFYTINDLYDLINYVARFTGGKLESIKRVG